MTETSTDSRRQWVFDSTILNHFALAERIDVLGYIVGGQQCVTTTNVLDELRNGAARLPGRSCGDRVFHPMGAAVGCRRPQHW